MSAAVRLPEMWWTVCASVVDKHDNEWTEYLDVLAATRDEAYERADAKVLAKGLGISSASVHPCPEKRVTPEDRVLALPAPIHPATAPTPPPPFFDSAMFTRYSETTQTAAYKEAV